MGLTSSNERSLILVRYRSDSLRYGASFPILSAQLGEEVFRYQRWTNFEKIVARAFTSSLRESDRFKCPNQACLTNKTEQYEKNKFKY
jgi:hypothetical protein